MSKPVGRTFYFEKELWSKLDDDARRCLRSSTKQMEAILKTYFGVDNVELNQTGLEMLGELAPKSEKKMPMIRATAAAGAEQETGTKKKKRA
jgi:hypothetical protein